MLGFAALGETALAELPAGMVVIAASGGAYTITGHDVGLYAARILNAEAGTFAVTGSSIELVRGTKGLRVIPGGGSRGLSARSGGGSKRLRVSA